MPADETVHWSSPLPQQVRARCETALWWLGLPAALWAVVAVAWLCAFVPPFVVMQWFLSPASALLGAVLLGIAVLLLRHRLFARQRVAQSVGSQA